MTRSSVFEKNCDQIQLTWLYFVVKVHRLNVCVDLEHVQPLVAVDQFVGVDQFLEGVEDDIPSIQKDFYVGPDQILWWYWKLT